MNLRQLHHYLIKITHGHDLIISERKHDLLRHRKKIKKIWKQDNCVFSYLGHGNNSNTKKQDNLLFT